MNPLSLKDPAGFGNEFLRLTLLQGFQSLTKRDLELLIFVLLERDGALMLVAWALGLATVATVGVLSGSLASLVTPWIDWLI